MTSVSFTWIVLIVVTLLMRACFMFFQMELFSCLPRHQPEGGVAVAAERYVNGEKEHNSAKREV